MRTCVTNIVFQKIFILVRHLSKIMFDNLRGKKGSLTKYIYFFYFSSFFEAYQIIIIIIDSQKKKKIIIIIYRKWTNEISKRSCLISSRVLAPFPSQFPPELST